MEEVPSIEIKLHSLQSSEDTSEVLSGKYHACILPRESRPDRKLDVRPLFKERFVLGCSVNHPLAETDTVRGEDLLAFPFVDRLKCEFRDQILDHFARGRCSSALVFAQIEMIGSSVSSLKGGGFAFCLNDRLPRLAW